MACPFLDERPLEIRNEIYSYLLSTQCTKRPVCDDKRPPRVKRGLECSHFYDFQPAILLTNKQINKEARHFLYDDNLLVLVRYPYRVPLGMLWTEDMTLLAAKEDEVCSFRSVLRITMHVDVGIQGKDNLHLESGFVIAATDLPKFCRILKQLDNGTPGLLSSIGLVLGIFPSYPLDVKAFVNVGPSSCVSSNPRPLSQQRRLVEPFAALHSIANLRIADVNGKTEYIDAQLMEDVKKTASRPPYSMEEVLDTSAKIKEQGNEAFHAGGFALASSLYISALENLDAGKRYLIRGIPGGKFAGQTYFHAHFVIEFRIQSNFVAALLRLQQWLAAHKRATRVIEEIESVRNAGGEIIFDPGEIAKLHYRRALASEGMGAVEEIRGALCLDPNNTKMRAKLKEWKLQPKSPKQIQAALNALTM